MQRCATSPVVAARPLGTGWPRTARTASQADR